MCQQAMPCLQSDIFLRFTVSPFLRYSDSPFPRFTIKGRLYVHTVHFAGVNKSGR